MIQKHSFDRFDCLQNQVFLFVIKEEKSSMKVSVIVFDSLFLVVSVFASGHNVLFFRETQKKTSLFMRFGVHA